MSDPVKAMVASAIAIVIVMLITWLISLPLRNASIVDIVWGFVFVVVAWTAHAVVDGDSTRQWLLTAMVTIWGLRLAVYLGLRNIGKPEDYRYQAMRRRAKGSFAVKSLWFVFGMQAALAWIVSLPVQIGAGDGSPGVGVIAAIGIVVWAVGLLFETLGDAQLARFKRDPANAGAVMNRGLWRYTRHPNYFGDFCVWWGIWLVAAETVSALWTVIGPVVMSVLLTRVSGVPMLERSMSKRRPGYDEYVKRTSAFFPRPPRRT